MGYHTPEQIERAFIKAAKILAQIEALGVKFPSIELCADASGTLWFLEPVTIEQWDKLTELVRSDYLYPLPLPPGQENRIGVQFGYGLIDYDWGEEKHDD